MPTPPNKTPVAKAPASKMPALTPTQAASVASDILTRIIALIDEIVKMMEEEIPLVESRKRAEHAELLKRKQRATLDYRASLKTIVMQPDLLRQAPEELRLKARDAGRRLAEACERNARTLRAVMTASQRLVQSIVSLVKQEVLPTTGYTNVQSSKSSQSYSPTCKPITVFKSA